jgi:glycosyltransferase involved in cell wall biosynthesis
VSDPLRIVAVEDGTACGYYRIRLPFEQMLANGHDVDVVADGTHVEDDFPILVAQRMGYPGFQMQWLKMWRDHKLVWETDDDLWSIDPTNVRAATVFTPEFLAAVEQCARTAHMVTVSTEPLAEVMSRFNSNVVVLPNHIDGALLDIERPQRDRLTIGWAGGDSHWRDWEYVAPYLRRFLARNPEVGFHNIGYDFRRAAKLDLTQARYTGWSPFIFDYYRNIDFDIGLAPLVPSVFNRSKSHIKALEYAALGIPVIASDVAPYRNFVIDGVTGFLVSRDHEWEQRLRDLVNDEAMRTEMGAKAKEHARTYAIQSGWQMWADAYRSLL